MEISIYTFCVILRNIYILYYVFLCFYCEINQYNTKKKKGGGGGGGKKYIQIHRHTMHTESQRQSTSFNAIF